MTLLRTPHLKVDPNSDLDAMIAGTHRGMAGWSGGGPPGTTCGTCVYFKVKAKHLADGKCFLILPGARKTRGDKDVYAGSTASCRHYQSKHPDTSDSHGT